MPVAMLHENSIPTPRGLKRHLAWWIVVTLVVVGWWLPLLDAVLFHFGMWRSDQATGAVVGYMIFVTMPLSALAALLSLYKALRWAVKQWKGRATAATL